MTKSQIYYNGLIEKLSSIRRRCALYNLFNDLALFLCILISSALILLSTEIVFRLASGLRSLFDLISVIGLSLFLIAIKFKYIASILNRVKNLSNESLCRKIERLYPEIKDRLLNAIQLYEKPEEMGFYSQELIGRSLRNVYTDVKKMEFKKVVPRKALYKKLKFLALSATFSLLIFTIFAPQYKDAAIHILHPTRDFPVSPPFSLSIKPGNTSVLWGEDVKIEINSTGRHPSHVELSLRTASDVRVIQLPADSEGVFTYTLKRVSKPTRYLSYVEDNSFWEKWDIVSTSEYEISVINRPLIKNLLIKLTYPAYSAMPPTYQEANIGEIAALKGTEVSVKVSSNKPISEAFIVFSDSTRTAMQVNENSATGNFSLMRNGSYHILLRDIDLITNPEPVEYRLTALRDEYPLVRILSPGRDIDLDRSMIIPLKFEIEDDFGFSGVKLLYSVQSKEEHSIQDEREEISIPGIDNKLNSQKLNYFWDLSNLTLSPGDIIRYRLKVYDSDMISGPKHSLTDEYTARFPSITEIFEKVAARQEESLLQTEDVIRETKELKEIVDKFSQQLKKTEKLDWSERKEIEETLKKQKELNKNLEKISKNLEAIVNQLDNNQLLSEETLRKYMELQELFREIATPELLEAMEKLQKAISQIDPEQIRKSMEQFKLSQETFLKNLERVLEIFKRIKIEQLIDEVTKRLEALIEEQQKVLDKAENIEPSDMETLNELASEEKSIRGEYSQIEGKMGELGKLMSDFDKMPVSELDSIMKANAIDSIANNLSAAENLFKSGNSRMALTRASIAREGMLNALKRMRNFQSTFMKNQMAEVISQFRDEVKKLLNLSMNQENLQEKTEGLPSSSPSLNDIAEDQLNLIRNLSRVTKNLIELSHKTFAVGPQIGMAIGRSYAYMNEALESLEKKRPGKSAEYQEKSMASLNESIMELRRSMEDLMQSGSPGGLEQYLKQLEKLSGQQRGINQQTLSLGFSGQNPAEMREALKRLAAEQASVKKSLEELYREMGKRAEILGRLDEISRMAEDVVKDLENRSIKRRTINLQRKILSRLLDAQKSLKERDFSEKRKSRAGVDVIREGPAKLPEDLGERTSWLNSELLKALKEGYAREYEVLIRNYFEALRKLNLPE